MVRVMAYLDHPTIARAAFRTTLSDTEGPIRLRNRAGHWGAFAECEAVTFFELDLGPDGNQLCIGQFGPRDRFKDGNLSNAWKNVVACSDVRCCLVAWIPVGCRARLGVSVLVSGRQNSKWRSVSSRRADCRASI